MKSHYYRLPSEGSGKVIVSVCSHFRGGTRSSLGWGVSMSQIFRGGFHVSDFWGGPRSQIFEGDPMSQIFGGIPGLRFLGGLRSQIWGGWYPVSVKGKIFDTRFGLIHVQTRKKIFVEGPPP